MPTINSDKSYAAGHLPAAVTTPTITPGAAQKLDLSTMILDLAVNFEIVEGSLKYTGSKTAVFMGVSSLSMSANVNNTLVKFYRGKNGVQNENTELQRKIGTGSDVGALALVFAGSLSKDDVIDIFIDSSLEGTVTIENLNLTIHNVTL